jgi:predicted site-specific integrase-resolvase
MRKRRSGVPTVVDSDELFTIVEASCLLGISRATVRAAVVRGDLDPVVTTDGSRRITRNSVLRYGGR